MRDQSTCSVDDCDKPTCARTYCQKHYRRWRLYGDPLLRKPVTNFKDLAGRTFERLTVLSQAPRPEWAKDTNAYWRCHCTCGNVVTLRAASLLSGRTRSCGCLKVELDTVKMSAMAFRHGQTDSPTYRSWQAMKARVLDPNHHAYDRYGGWGVKIHELWIHSFEAFLADMGERPEGRTLDRRDPYGDYTPENCRWATWSEQNRNKRRLKDQR